MDLKKISLYAIFAILATTLWNDWIKEHPTAAPVAKAAVQSVDQSFVPTSYQSNSKSQTQNEITPIPSATVKQKIIHVKTDVLSLDIDAVGGSIINAALLKYPDSLGDKNIPVEILSNDPTKLYIAETGLTQASSKPITYNTSQAEYQLPNNSDSLDVVLKGVTANGISVIKTYRFKRDDYAIGITDQIENHTASPWTTSLYSQFKKRPQSVSHGFMQPRSFEGAAISSPEKRYKKFTYAELEKENISNATKDGWFAIVQHYFLGAWVPDSAVASHYYSHVSSLGDGEDNKVYTVGFVSPEFKIDSNQSINFNSTLYIGPETKSRLDRVAPGLDLTIDYGWLWMISEIIFWVMDHINSIIGNWGWSIVLVTILIKLLFYKLSAASYRSMAKMRELQPKITTLRERFGDDKQKLNQAMMELYKKDKINPLGGCLPVVIQIPVFIALYYVLFESVELRQAPFILWIHDLSAKDPFYILPVLMGISMFVQQRLSPPPPDPTQAKVMMFLPVIFTGFFLSFPSGLVLYWFVNNCLSVTQQWYIMRQYQETHKKLHKK